MKRLPGWMRNPWLAQALLALALMALFVWQADTHQIAESLRKVRAEWLVIALLIYVVLRFLQALETRIVLTNVGRIPLLGLYAVLFVGSLVNAVLPANMGDVAKVQIMANKYGMPRVGLVASRGAETVVNAFMFVVFVIVGVVLASGQSESSGSLQIVLAGISTLACALLVTFAVFMPKTLPKWSLLRHLPDGVERALEEQWPHIYEGFEAIRRPKLIAMLLLLNIVGWCIEIGMYWAYGHAFNLDVPIGAYVSVAVVVALVTTFPITFGNVGSWEVGILAALHVYSVPAETALAFAVGSHIFVSLFNIGLGLISMLLLGVSPHDLLKVKNDGKAPPAEEAGPGAQASPSASA